MWTYVSAHELYHYGIKGQKWGVRRFQNKDGSLTPAGKKRYNPGYKTETRDDGSYVIKKGSKVHRVTANPNSKHDGYAYVSFMDADVKGYKKEITSWLEEEKGVCQTYDLTMKVTKDLILPDEVEKVKTFIDLMGKEKIDTTEMFILRDEMSNPDGELVGRPQKVRDGLMNQGMDKSTATAYALFSMCLFRDDNYKKEFFNALKKKGYNAIEDIEDSYSHRMKPVIVFERENTLKITNVEKIPQWDVDPDAWEQIAREADAGREETLAYQKYRGIKR